MKKIIIYYSFIIVSIMTLIGFFQAQTIAQIVSAVLFFPLAIYFTQLVLPNSRKALIVPKVIPSSPMELTKSQRKLSKKIKTSYIESFPSNQEDKEEKGVVLEKARLDIDKRMFLKLIGGAGITVFLFSLFSKKAEGAFFGSVPGPGTLALKDISGNKIDPAEKYPTSGYKIAQIDDTSSSTYAYYGFTNKDGAWFIQRETLTGVNAGDYRYTKGDTDFSDNWTNNKVTPTIPYNYFDEIF